MQAFHNDVAVKEKYLSRVQDHADADEIVKGQYWENGKGCAIGCTIHGASHTAYEKELGIPRIIARLEDGIFEGLPNAEAKKFPKQFLEAIPVGANLSWVWPKFAVWMLVDPDCGVIRFARTNEQREAISKVAELYQRQIAGKKIALGDWRAARAYADAAYAAYADAANAAVYAAYAAYADAANAAAYAAYAAVEAAADAANAAAYAAVEAARGKTRIKQRDKLLKLLSDSCEVK